MKINNIFRIYKLVKYEILNVTESDRINESRSVSHLNVNVFTISKLFKNYKWVSLVISVFFCSIWPYTSMLSSLFGVGISLMLDYELQKVMKRPVVLLGENSPNLVGVELKSPLCQDKYPHSDNEEASGYCCKKDSGIFSELFLSHFHPSTSIQPNFLFLKWKWLVQEPNNNP